MVQVDYGADALGDIDGGGAVHEFGDGLLDATFGRGIQGAGAVVQDDHLGLRGQGAVDR